MHDEHGNGNLCKPLAQPVVGARQFRYRIRRLYLVCDEPVGIHRCDDCRVTGEVLIIQLENMGMRGEMAQPLKRGDSEVRGGHLIRKALTDQTAQLGLMFERIEAGDDATGAMPKHEDRDPRMVRFCDLDDGCHIVDVVTELLDIVALAIRLSAPAQVERMHTNTIVRERLAYPLVVAAV